MIKDTIQSSLEIPDAKYFFFKFVYCLIYVISKTAASSCLHAIMSRKVACFFPFHLIDILFFFYSCAFPSFGWVFPRGSLGVMVLSWGFGLLFVTALRKSFNPLPTALSQPFLQICFFSINLFQMTLFLARRMMHFTISHDFYPNISFYSRLLKRNRTNCKIAKMAGSFGMSMDVNH